MTFVGYMVLLGLGILYSHSFVGALIAIGILLLMFVGNVIAVIITAFLVGVVQDYPYHEVAVINIVGYSTFALVVILYAKYFIGS